MATKEVVELAKEIEQLPNHDAQLTRRALDTVVSRFSDADKAMIEAGSLDSVDATLLLVDHCFPGWSVSMDGTASEAHGDWTCTLRQSSVRDNDSYLGVGRGPRLSNALLAALLRAMAMSGQS